MIEKVKITEVFSNPVNPRTIKEAEFKKLVKSIKDFPEIFLNSTLSAHFDPRKVRV